MWTTAVAGAPVSPEVEITEPPSLSPTIVAAQLGGGLALGITVGAAGMVTGLLLQCGDLSCGTTEGASLDRVSLSYAGIAVGVTIGTAVAVDLIGDTAADGSFVASLTGAMVGTAVSVTVVKYPNSFGEAALFAGIPLIGSAAGYNLFRKRKPRPVSAPSALGTGQQMIFPVAAGTF